MTHTSIGSNRQRQIPCETPLSLTLYPFSLSVSHDNEIPREMTYFPLSPKQLSPMKSGNTNSNPSEASPQTSSSSVFKSLLRPEYQYEASRLETFHNWPENATVRKEELAQAGFVDTVNPFYLAFLRPKCISVLLIWRLADPYNVTRYAQRMLASF